MLKKVLMVLRRQMLAVVLVVVVVLTTAAAVLTTRQTIKARVARDARNAQQTEIEIRAFVGNSAENKLGGIEFAVSDYWNYHRIIFQVWGLDKGLNLDKVVCYGSATERYDFDPNHPEWDLWLVRYQRVLIAARENAYLIDKTQSP